MKVKFENIKGRLQEKKATFQVELDSEEINFLNEFTGYNVAAWIEQSIKKEYRLWK